MNTRQERKAVALSLFNAVALLGDLNQVRAIVDEFGDDPEVMNAATATGETSLILAVLGGHTEVVNILLTARELNRNATSQAGAHTGLNALMLAACYGKDKIVEMLAIDGRTTPNHANARGETALILASIWCLPAVPVLTKMHNILPNLVDQHQHSALYFAIIRLSKFTPADELPAHIAALLAMPGIELETKNKKEWSPLMIAAGKGHLPTVRALLEAGADPCYCLENGYTAAKIAYYAKHTNVMQLIETYAAEKRAPSETTLSTSQLGLFATAAEALTAATQPESSVNDADNVAQKPGIW